jgi:hypothetical protein
MGDEIYICERCRGVVDRDDSTLVTAAELVRLPALGDAQSEVMEGAGVFFHARCWSGNDKRYRRKS